MQSALLLPSHAVRSCRFIAGRRYALASSAPYRSFHHSTPWRSKPSSDANGSSGVSDDTPREMTPADVHNHSLGRGVDPAATKHSTPKRRSYIETIRNSMRDRRILDEKPPRPITVPQWYLDHNVTPRHESPSTDGPEPAVGIFSKYLTKDESESQAQLQATGGDGVDASSADQSHGGNNPGPRYLLSPPVWDSLRGLAKAGFMLPSPEYANDPATENSHLLLQTPYDDGVTFLDKVVQKLARELDASLVTLNALDIAELCTEQERLQGLLPSSIRNLSYEIYSDRGEASFWPDAEGEASEREDSGPEETSGTFIAPLPAIRPRLISSDTNLPDIRLPNWIQSFTEAPGPNRVKRLSLDTITTRTLLNEILSAAGKQQPAAKGSNERNSESGSESAAKVIIQVQDYLDLKSSRQGAKVLEILQEIVRYARRRGEKLLLIGTTSKDPDFTLDFAPPVLDGSKMMSIDEVKDFPNSIDNPFPRTFLIAPATNPERTRVMFDEDRKARTRLVNIRHLQQMLRTRVNPDTTPVDRNLLDSTSWELDSKTALATSLEAKYWYFGRIHALVTYAMGCVEPNETLSLTHIQQAFQIVDENEKTGEHFQESAEESTETKAPPNAHAKSVSALLPKCNKYEKKLLTGVVKPESIRTTFSDVHVQPETVEAINSLTSLSLIRPEAFSYGVLATDRIPGILLYGPPGTGKTLLAKAVARESGATVLEVSGSDIYDMYVGEGEKNVRAIFSLAKKLSPCVVFIDEADAMLGSRSQGRHRSSHRELINQFLREWDGMNDMSAFLMVATNRPFDLDDAVLRRLPRRLLVDLPTEKDREAILRIHLKDEQLDASVDLSELAHRTPFYSGSDLKNVCVAAALACVREEHARLMQQKQPHPFSARRVLTKAHFERGIEEISASISEDMSSLNAIRKFDEKYGDRKGRRKRSAAWGFASPKAAAEAETGDTGRVRA